MLIHPTLNKLRELRLTGMADALEEQLNNPEFQDLDFDGGRMNPPAVLVTLVV